MKGECYKKRGEDERFQLLDLIPKEIDWNMRDSEEKKLQLRLGPPGEEEEEEEEKEKSAEEEDDSVLCLSLFYKSPNPSSNNTSPTGSKRVFSDTIEPKTKGD